MSIYFPCTSQIPGNGDRSAVEKCFMTVLNSTASDSDDFLHRVSYVFEFLHFNCRGKNLEQAEVLNTSIGSKRRWAERDSIESSTGFGFFAEVSLSQFWFRQQHSWTLRT